MNIKQAISFFLFLLFAYNSGHSQNFKETVSAIYSFDKEEEIADWLV